MPKQICVAAPPPKSELEHRQAVNKGSAQFVPTVLIGIVGYATWVVIVTLGAHYLLHPSPNTVPSRTGTGIAIITLYVVFLLPVAITYFRLLGTVKDPGFTPQGKPCASTPIKPKQEEQVERHVVRCCTNTKVTERPPSTSTASDVSRPSSAEKPGIGPHGQDVTTLDLEAIFRGDVAPPPGLESFYEKDVFACDQTGLPVWCGTCCNWKPDRTRHCSDVGRCVRKLDHFCPWVGGVVAEKNFKFFIQFNCYTAIFTCYIMIVMAYFVAEAKSNPHVSLNVHWCVVLGLGALFTLFTGSMAATSMRLAFLNLTTIDNIDHLKRTMYLAVLVNARIHSRPITSPPAAQLDQPGFTYQASTPRPQTSSTSHSRHSRNIEKPPNSWEGTITYPIYTKPSSPSSSTFSAPNSEYPQPTLPPPRTFAILRTTPGSNPWNMGTLENFKSVMGKHWYDWFLPLRYSPCCDHDRGDSFYEFGSDVETLKREAGLLPPLMVEEGMQRSRKKRRHRRRETESQESMGSTLGTCDGQTGRGSRQGRREEADEEL